MIWIEWLVTGFVGGVTMTVAGVAYTAHYMIKHMDKYAPRMMRAMVRRTKK